MFQGRLYSCCDAGLSNRLFVLAGCVRIAEITHRELFLVWPNNKWLPCEWHDLFETKVNVATADDVEHHVFGCDDSLKVYNADSRKEYVDIDQEDTHSTVLVKGWSSPFFKTDFDKCAIFQSSADFLRSLQPVQHVAEQVESFSASFGRRTVGVHVRQGDQIKQGDVTLEHTDHFPGSSVESFKRLMNAELFMHPHTVFFLATEHVHVFEELKQVYGKKLMTYPKRWEGRFTVYGMVDALIELLLLSRCMKIVGTANSQFSRLAATVGPSNNIIVAADKNEPDLQPKPTPV